ncbi:leucine-rich repeat extensin-like protein 5 [Drosophila santomea]|uniref:leucine-rich repeat extensin-like protein 5 n=1 Tax=Drosophila santomea TaxID=129105 RepID=UPI001952F9FF|nr:leucine-rich repeat extensin-like protein 5 [Drosophila santomea]XP_039481591.1 leucine-rich repeat extensin-like protein 5 [Drosophila santomea]
MQTQCILLLLAATLAICVARPEPPRSRYGPPPPAAPQKEYGPPAPQAQPLPVYGPPAAFYGPPAASEALVTKNVYVHVPPEEPEFYPASSPIQTAVPKKHYKIIFIKAPNPPTPVRQVLPPPVQDEHKTLVYVLVKKPEEQQPVILPAPEPTEPSKPEVYFIKYKQQQPKPATQYGPPPSAPSEEYGAPPAPRTVEQF